MWNSCGFPAVEPRLRVVSGLLARWLLPRPLTVWVAEDLVKTHDLVSVVASVDGPVVEVTTRQVNVAVRRVRQLGTFLKERKKGANIFKLFQVAICQKQTHYSVVLAPLYQSLLDKIECKWSYGLKNKKNTDKMILRTFSGLMHESPQYPSQRHILLSLTQSVSVSHFLWHLRSWPSSSVKK